MLTRRKDSDTYLATVSRHRWSAQITMKVDKIDEMMEDRHTNTHTQKQNRNISTDTAVFLNQKKAHVGAVYIKKMRNTQGYNRLMGMVIDGSWVGNGMGN